MLSLDADCGVIWLHTPRIHIRFFGAHVVIHFLGTHTLKAQRPSTSDKFLGSLGALNITYSMFIQMGHAIRDIVIVTLQRGFVILGTSFASLHFLLFVNAVVQGEASECKIARGRLDGLFSCPTPIRTALVEGSVEGIAILAAVLVRVAMPIADTNPHSSMVDEDGNERVPESILLGTVSEDGLGHIGATSLLRGTARAISNVWPIPLRFATLRV